MSSSDEGNDTILVGPGDVRDFNSDNILPLPTHDLVAIREWLQPTPYDQERSEYSRHRASHLVGTGRWLTSSATYQQWQEGEEHGLLWIKGIPGSGKSVMAASIIDQLRKEDVPVLHFFFRQIIDANHQPVAALRDWLCQVLNYSPPLQVKLKKYIDNRRSIESLSFADLWKDLKMALAVFPKAYCVTDALDEMDQGNDGFLRDLVALGQWRPANVKVLITSRPVAIVESSLRSFSIPQIRLEERLVDSDIAAYVQYRLRNSPVPHDSWKVIEEAIPGRANGLFLYAKLSMDAFVEPGADAREVLKALPADLNVMYNDLLREHAKRSNVPDELQHLVLQFVTHATRPLRLLEMAEMVKSTYSSSRVHSLKETKDLVRAACGPLLEVLPDETVSVVHHSFTEFLKGYTRSGDSDGSTYPVLQAGPTNQRLVTACLDYLTAGCLDNVPITPKNRGRRDSSYEFFHPKKERQSTLRLQFPFMEYATGNWYTHARRAALAGSDMTAIHQRLDSFLQDKQKLLAWLEVEWPSPSIQGLTSLHVAAWTGLDQYAIHLFQKEKPETEARDERGNTPLYWAASAGHADAARVLIANGAEPDAEGTQGLKPLHQAASNNHAAVIKVLLDAGVDPLTPKTRETPGRFCGNAPTSVGHTPLMYACQNGHLEAVAAFMPFLKDLDACHRALGWAALAGHAPIVDLILQHPGVDVNSKTLGDTPLFKACRSGDQKTIEVLVRAGADPNMHCADAEDEYAGIVCVGVGNRRRKYSEPRGFTALHALCKDYRSSSGKASAECVKLLVDAGANVHMKTVDGSTALHYACKNNINLIKSLLEAGADPTAETDDGNTPLHTDGKTDKELLPVLLSTGVVDINKQTSKDGKTPLLCRLASYHTESALAFLSYKPDVHKTDSEGNGPLHLVMNSSSMRKEKESLVQALISAGANPNLKNRQGDTPLHCVQDNDNFVSPLFEAGADIEAKNHKGQTALFKNIKWDSMSSFNKKPQLFELLLDSGAQLHTRDYKGRTLLHECCQTNERFDQLVRLGLDPAATDYEGNTPLMEAARSDSSNKTDFLKHLVSCGLEVDQKNIHGRSVLHTLCSQSGDRTHLPMNERPLDFVLRVCKNVDPVDHRDITPLHLAASISEEYVFKLLNAGADLFKATRDGMTALHIAARARQSGIVCLLLSKLKALDEEKRRSFIDKKDRNGRGALHHACRSGRPETVQALLEAGADVNLLDEKYCSPFQACAEFEAEQELWNGFIHNSYHGQVLKAAGVVLDEEKRPFREARDHAEKVRGWTQLSTEQDTTRLPEIFNMLVSHGAHLAEKGSIIPRTFGEAIRSGREYTVDCITRLAASTPDAKPIEYAQDNEDYLLCTCRLEATKRAFRNSGKFKNLGDISARSALETRHRFMTRLLAGRQYDLFEERAAAGEDLAGVTWQGKSLLHILVDWGFDELLARVATREAAANFDDHEWRQKMEKESQCRRSSIQPLILTACNRSLPNMKVLKVLVEIIGVDINAQRSEYVYHRKGYETVISKGALHKLASGDSWWQVEKALPYLIDMGANLELRDQNGLTPLQLALCCTDYKGPFYKEAARILVESGADVNATNNAGQTCLSLAVNDLDAIKLLLAYGAKVSAAAIFSAIDLAETGTLEVLLSQGDYANLRRPGPTKPQGTHRQLSQTQIIASEMTPLLRAAINDTSSFRRKKETSSADRKRVMKILLEHGADPYASFQQHVQVAGTTSHSPFESTDDEEDPNQNWKSYPCTVIHEILSGGHLFDPFLQLPSLDLEYRDPNGCTLILSAAKRPQNCQIEIDAAGGEEAVAKDVIRVLLKRGADATVQDNDGRTILHHLITNRAVSSRLDESSPGSLQDLIKTAPGLVHQPDHVGNTPLHYALSEQKWDICELLLRNGADPLQPDSDGNTGLHHLAGKAATAGKANDLLNQFMQAGVDINSRNNKGDTPLFKYVQRGFSSRYALLELEKGDQTKDPIFDLFKSLGADFFARNDMGSSLLHELAAKKVRSTFGRKDGADGVVARFKLLMEMGLDPMAEDARQRTSLDVAAACDGEHILKLFERKPME
ncbi:uncharacterized protein N7459_001997 [Penicillium hispanicum]|uniref:uncharacterized protein n=1 Tax=Penicillium hispanicum TaxID=1080232 RepID=UPI0025400F85|nr:uncharacterized protein N7459_001997 [Penicillium hispanicum]KAJ5591628.1 hypothetical protein N7459_001997 [Penicillium hispanicum]